MRVAVYSRVAIREHPYFILFHRALGEHDIAVDDAVSIDTRWLSERRDDIDAVHLHWPETIWRSGSSGTPSFVAQRLHTCRQLLQVWRFLRRARRLGITRVWTVHNIEPHEDTTRWDRLGYRLVARQSDVVICHTASAANLVRERYHPHASIVLMPMGPLAAVYPPARPRADVLAGVGLDPSVPVVSCLGRLRGYKGLDVAVAAIACLAGRVQLVIGGPRQIGFDADGLARTAGRGIVVLPRRLSDQEFADLMSASDAVLLPYRHVTSSAVLLTAFGFGRGVVAADLPAFREVLVHEPDAGMLVEGADPATWAAAIERYLAVPAAARQAAASSLAERFAWSRSVIGVVEALRSHRTPPGVHTRRHASWWAEASEP